VQAAINIQLRVARHFNRPSLWCRCTPGGLAGGYLGSANPAVEEGARARKGRETSVKLESLSPPAAPKSFPDLNRGPGPTITRSWVHFCQTCSSRSLVSCATCVQKKERKKWAYAFIYDSKTYNVRIVLILIIINL